MDPERGENRDESSAELNGIIDEFLDWAGNDGDGRDLSGLPELREHQPLGPGSRIGDFVIVRLLGAGGMGRVFEAHQVSVEKRRVALKVLRTAFLDAQTIERFRREVAAVASLHHEGIVPILAADVAGDLPYFAMPYVEGISCAQLLRKLRGMDNGQPSTRAVGEFLGDMTGAPAARGLAHSDYASWAATLCMQLCDALGHAHAAGMCHRDIKPANVMITTQGRAVLVDFGLARRFGDESLTQTGAFLGTPAYSAPEQLRGEVTDTRADVYSAGALLYELLTLHKPFDAAHRGELVRRIELEDPPSMGSAVPAELRAICQCAMSKSPARRYANGNEMADDLRAFLSGTRMQAKPRAPWVTWGMAVRRHPVLAAVVLVLAMFAASTWARSQVLAAEAVSSGLSEYEHYGSEVDRLHGLRLEVRSILEWKENGRQFDALELERLRQRERECRADLELIFARASVQLQAAFEHVANDSAARRGLADLHAERFELALENAWDVLEPLELHELEAQLAAFDDEGKHVQLIKHSGRVRLDCAVPGAHLRLSAGADGDTVYAGLLPFERDDLPGGYYVAHVQADGHAPVDLPLFVRRDAVYSNSDARPLRERTIELFPTDQVGDGWIVIPAGWTLLEVDPPRWEYIETFIMQRLEVSFADWLAWMNAQSVLGLEHHYLGMQLPNFTTESSFIPRDGNGRGKALIELDAETNTWRMPPGSSDLIPVRGLSIHEMNGFAVNGGAGSSARPPGWEVALPTVAEWRRAARGADGREFPWGDDFRGDACSWLLSEAALNTEPHPVDVGSYPGDRSPFGVVDMAGSILEATRDLIGLRREAWAVCGGCYRSTRSSQLRISSLREGVNQPRWDTGLRLVMRPMEPIFRAVDVPPAPFVDDFERADSVDVGGGWWEGSTMPAGLPADPLATEQVSIVDGRLVCLGGVGNGSESSLAIHRIAVGPMGFDAEFVISATALVEQGLRAHGLMFCNSFRNPAQVNMRLDVTAQGGVSFSLGGASSSTHPANTFSDPRAPKRFKLHWTPEHISFSITSLDGLERAEQTLDHPAGTPTPRYVVLTGSNYCGQSLIVDEVAVRPR